MKMKILGFNFSHEPNAIFHVCGVIDKLYNRLWTLRFLKKSGMGTNKLMVVYKQILRPCAEYCSNVYNSLIPSYISDKLEQVQRQAMKIVFGYGVKYEELVANGTIETLKDRRERNSLKFALKTLNNDRFSSRWFPKYAGHDQNIRATTRRVFFERKARTERMRSNPISYMTSQLNKHYNEQQLT